MLQKHTRPCWINSILPTGPNFQSFSVRFNLRSGLVLVAFEQSGWWWGGFAVLFEYRPSSGFWSMIELFVTFFWVLTIDMYLILLAQEFLLSAAAGRRDWLSSSLMNSSKLLGSTLGN